MLHLLYLSSGPPRRLLRSRWEEVLRSTCEKCCKPTTELPRAWWLPTTHGEAPYTTHDDGVSLLPFLSFFACICFGIQHSRISFVHVLSDLAMTFLRASVCFSSFTLIPGQSALFLQITVHVVFHSLHISNFSFCWSACESSGLDTHFYTFYPSLLHHF